MRAEVMEFGRRQFFCLDIELGDHRELCIRDRVFLVAKHICKNRKGREGFSQRMDANEYIPFRIKHSLHYRKAVRVEVV